MELVFNESEKAVEAAGMGEEHEEPGSGPTKGKMLLDSHMETLSRHLDT